MKPKQAISLFSLTVIVISLIIGMGIFKTPATVAAKSGTEFIFFAAWIIGGIVTLLGALIYAEIGQRLPAMGGYYKVFSYCYHPAIGFTINILILISNAATLAVIALIGADYVSDLLFNQPSGTLFNIAVAAISVAAFYFVNLSGLKTSTQLQNVLTVIKTALVILLIATLLKGTNVIPHGYNDDVIHVYNGHNALILLLISLVSVLFTYSGYQQAINFGSEVSSGKIMKRGIIIGVLISIFLYLAINYAYIKIIGFNEIKNANAIGALLFEVWFGKFGAKIFDICMILSVLGYVNITLLSNPRVMFSMSEDKVLPRIFQNKHHKTEALSYGLAAFSALTIIITFFGKQVDDILSFSVFLDCIGMTGSVATLFILRKKKQGDKFIDGNLAKFTPFFTVLYIIFYMFISVAVIIDKPLAALTSVVLLFVTLGLYWVFYRSSKKY